MKLVIKRYLDFGKQTKVAVPQGSVIAGCCEIHDDLYIVFLANPERDVEERTFYATASDVPESVVMRKPIATVSAMGLAWVIFEER